MRSGAPSYVLEDGRQATYTYDSHGNRLTRAIDGTHDRTWILDRLAAELGIRVAELNGSGAPVHAWTPDPVPVTFCSAR